MTSRSFIFTACAAIVEPYETRRTDIGNHTVFFAVTKLVSRDSGGERGRLSAAALSAARDGAEGHPGRAAVVAPGRPLGAGFEPLPCVHVVFFFNFCGNFEFSSLLQILMMILSCSLFTSCRSVFMAY